MYNYYTYWNETCFNIKKRPKSKCYDDYVRLLKKYLGKYNLVLDGGCGEGGYFNFFKSFCGLDISKKRLNIARIYNNPVCCGDMTSFPFRDSCFDASCTVQVLMHIPSNLIKKVLNEFIRVTSKRLVHLEYYSDKNIKLSKHCFNHNLKKLYNELGWKLIGYEKIPTYSQIIWIFEEY